MTGSLNLDVSGSLGASAQSVTTNLLTNGNGTLTIGVNIGNLSAFAQRTYASQHVGGQPGTNGIVIDDAPLTGLTFPDTVVFSPFTVLTGVPVSLEVRLFTFGGASMNFSGLGEGSAKGRAEFGATASFPTSGPVFDLPTGYSVDSASALLVDNTWSGTPVSAALVPLPPGLWLMASGLVLCRRRRTAQTDS